MRDFVKVLFYFTNKKANKLGLAPIYCRITIRGRRSEISTGIYVMRDHFANGAIIPSNEMLVNQQKQLDLIKLSLNRIETDLRIKEEFISPERLKEFYINGFKSKTTFLEIAEEYLNKKAKMIELDYSIKNYDRYKRTIDLINEFILTQYKRKDFAICEIKQAFADDFYLYCRTEKKHAVNYYARHLLILKSIISYAVVNDYADKNYLANCSVKKTKQAPLKHLSIEQIRIIRDAKFDAMRLNNVRDCFLFQCFTGLAYVDLAKFSAQNIQTETSGFKWIIIHRSKTNVKSTIPLLQEAEQIVNKYMDLTHRVDDNIKNSGVLPVYSNQKMNAYLKDIGKICNLPLELLSTHTARKTFAMIVLNNSKASLDSVSKMLGHAKVAMTQKHYAFVDTKKIANEMQDFVFINQQ